MGRKKINWIFKKAFVHTNCWTRETRKYMPGEIITDMGKFTYDNALSSTWPYRAEREGILIRESQIYAK